MYQLRTKKLLLLHMISFLFYFGLFQEIGLTDFSTIISNTIEGYKGPLYMTLFFEEEVLYHVTLPIIFCLLRQACLTSTDNFVSKCKYAWDYNERYF